MKEVVSDKISVVKIDQSGNITINSVKNKDNPLSWKITSDTEHGVSNIILENLSEDDLTLLYRKLIDRFTPNGFDVIRVNSTEDFEYTFYSNIRLRFHLRKNFFVYNYYSVDDDGNLYLYVSEPHWNDSRHCWLSEDEDVLLANISYVGDASLSLRLIIKPN